MRFVDEFRDPQLAKTLLEQLHQRAGLLRFHFAHRMQCGQGLPGFALIQSA